MSKKSRAHSVRAVKKLFPNEETKTISDYESSSNFAQNNVAVSPLSELNLVKTNSALPGTKLTKHDNYRISLSLYPKGFSKLDDVNQLKKFRLNTENDCIDAVIERPMIDKLSIFTSLSRDHNPERITQRSITIRGILNKFEDYKVHNLCFVHSKNDSKNFAVLETLVKILNESLKSTTLKFDPKMVQNKLIIIKFAVSSDSLKQIAAIFSHVKTIELIDCMMSKSLHSAIDLKQLNFDFEGHITAKGEVFKG